jgi:hypothetical protein
MPPFLLETVDLMLLRGILKASKSTPKEMLFLELGLVPFREIIRKKRLNFLFYILHESKDSMIYKFFESQRKKKTAKDWVTTILNDIKELELNMKIEDISNMKKGVFSNTVKRKIEYKTLKEFEKVKANHSKTKNLKHPELKMQDYLMPNINGLKLRQEECQLIFKLRSKVTKVKVNMKNNFESYECEACEHEEESQDHVLECKEISRMEEKDEEMENLPAYEKIMNGNVKEKLCIAKVFSKRFKIIESLRRKKK